MSFNFSDCVDATLISRAQPADFGHEQAMEKNVVRQFFGRPHGLLEDGNNMDIDIGQLRQSLQQRLRRRSEVGHGWGIIL
jgi:hypothetical protein